MTRGEYFLFLEGEERLCALKDTMEIVSIAVKSKADGTVYRYAFAWESSISECCVFFAEFFEHKKCWFGHP